MSKRQLKWTEQTEHCVLILFLIDGLMTASILSECNKARGLPGTMVLGDIAGGWSEERAYMKLTVANLIHYY